jgi:glycosyltransferase involved in cell wall biosynthesis
MRILLVSDFFPPTRGGMEAHVRLLAETLTSAGHSVGVVTGTPNPVRLPDDVAIHYAPTVLGRVPGIFQDGTVQYPPPFPDPAFRAVVRRVSESWRADIIHAHGWCAFSSYWAASPPLVVTLHDHGLRCPKRTLLRGVTECTTGIGVRCVSCPGTPSAVKRVPLAMAMRWSVPSLAARTSKFIAVSRSVARRAAETGVSASKIIVIPNFLDMSNREPAGAPADPRALFVGPDDQYKGRPVAIDAFSRLPPGSATLVLVGSRTPVNRAGVVNLGFLRGGALWEQYRQATVALVPAIWPEPCPTVVLEAMAYGLPVIGSRIGGIPDLVAEGSSGLLVPPNDADRLAESMHAVLTDHELRTRLSQGARFRAWQFDAAAVVPELVQVYESVVDT